ncbi:MAG: tyrosine-protein phosphatase [Mangrovibacterium sp.]
MNQLKTLSITFLIAFFGLGYTSTFTAKKNLKNTIENAFNFRDIGGYRTSNGKTVVFNKIYRSGDLSRLKQADTLAIKNLAIDQIIDLRTPYEAKYIRTVYPKEVEYLNIPLLTVDVEGNAQIKRYEQVLEGVIPIKEYMLSFYNEITQAEEEALMKIFDQLEEGKTTILISNAGKDRMGMTIALLLYALGVEKDLIVQDYMKSSEYLDGYDDMKWTRMLGEWGAKYKEQLSDRLYALWQVDENYIKVFFNTIEIKYGSIDNFLEILKVDKNQLKNAYLK